MNDKSTASLRGSGTFMGMPKWLAAAVVLGGLFFLAGQWIAGMPRPDDREITVQGTGEVTATPDVAMINLGVQTETLSTADEAQAALEQTFNTVLAAVEEQGIGRDDIKTTNLSVNPIYDFVEGQRQLRGYEANETIDITVRETDQVGAVLAAATRAGATQAGGVRFDIDDPQELEAQAREAAIADARENAEMLAQQLGVRLGKVKSFNSQRQGGGGPIPLAAREDALGGVETPAGTQEVVVTATITYELR